MGLEGKFSSEFSCIGLPITAIGPCWIQENGSEVETKRRGPSSTPFQKLGAAKYAGNCLHKRLREPDSQSICLRYVCVPGCNALSTDHHTRRFSLKLQDLLGCAMSAGKELHPNAIDSSSEDDGPGRLGVNLATSQCQLEAVRRLHSSLDPERDYLERSACQTAAGRALWNHVIHDPLAEVFAGDVFLRGLQEKVRRDQDKKARETAGVMMAVRTLWFDARLGEALARFDAASSDHQVVLLGAGMDARAYRLRALKDCAIFEVDSAKALHFKEAILQAMAEAGEALPCLAARSVHRVAADIASEDWFTLLTAAGFNVHLPTVWILEGFLYYLHEARAKETLRCITQHSVGETVVLADFMNESSTHLAHELKTHFYFHSDWPEELLPMLGFSQVKVSQIGDPDANFGLINDELNLFHQMRRVSRHVKADVNGKPYMRLLLVETSADR